jgi:glycosyltransferase involved in cell wall biosynthesis
MVGNFTGVRSQIVVCRAVKLLKEEGINAVDLYFVGKRVEAEPRCYDECLKYCMDNGIDDMVHFVGSRGDVPAILQHVDGFVYSSIRDSFGIAVVEALASGLPVVVNDWKVMVEIIKNNEWASFFHTNNENDCCEKILQLIESLELRKQQAQKHKVEVRNTYSIENHILNLNKIYEDVVCLSLN